MAFARTASYDARSNPDRLREEQASCIGATFQLLRGKPTALEQRGRTNAKKGADKVNQS